MISAWKPTSKKNNIIYPKCEVLVCPNNIYGIMNRGVSGEIARRGGNLYQEVKRIIKSKKDWKIGDIFITEPFRFNRRSVLKIYHIILTKYPNEVISLNIIDSSINSLLKLAVKKKMKSIAFPPFGIEYFEPSILAKRMLTPCENFNHLIDIKFISENENFVKIIEDYKKGK